MSELSFPTKLMCLTVATVLTKREEIQQLVFERKLLRTMYRRRYNFELEKEFDSPCVINVVKTNRVRYASHIPQYAVLIAKRTAIARPLEPHI
jgi:hypothetical protein